MFGDWLRSELGPAFGILSSLMFLIFLFPKLKAKWRDLRAPKEPLKRPMRGVRRYRPKSLSASDKAQVAKLQAHREHGAALLQLQPRRSMILGLSALTMLPLFANLSLGEGQRNLKLALLILTIPLAMYGLSILKSLFDRLTFYESGLVYRRFSRSYDVDYNGIMRITRRKASLPIFDDSFTLSLDDGHLLALDSKLFVDGAEKIRHFTKDLEARTILNAAHEELYRD